MTGSFRHGVSRFSPLLSDQVAAERRLARRGSRSRGWRARCTTAPASAGPARRRTTYSRPSALKPPVPLSKLQRGPRRRPRRGSVGERGLEPRQPRRARRGPRAAAPPASRRACRARRARTPRAGAAPRGTIWSAATHEDAAVPVEPVVDLASARARCAASRSPRRVAGGAARRAGRGRVARRTSAGSAGRRAPRATSGASASSTLHAARSDRRRRCRAPTGGSCRRAPARDDVGGRAQRRVGEEQRREQPLDRGQQRRARAARAASRRAALLLGVAERPADGVHRAVPPRELHGRAARAARPR